RRLESTVDLRCHHPCRRLAVVGSQGTGADGGRYPLHLAAQALVSAPPGWNHRRYRRLRQRTERDPGPGADLGAAWVKWLIKPCGSESLMGVMGPIEIMGVMLKFSDFLLFPLLP